MQVTFEYYTNQALDHTDEVGFQKHAHRYLIQFYI